MRFLTDAHVRDDVEDFLRTRGHEVFTVRGTLLPGTEDPVIVAHANQIQAIVVTWNRKHFRTLITRSDAKKADEYPHAGLLSLQCSLSRAVPLLERFMAHIELEFQERQAYPDKRVIIELNHDSMKAW